MSKFSTLELSFTSTIANLILTVKENKFCQTIIFKNCQRSQDATNLLRNFEFQKKFLKLNNARAIIFEINDDLLDITIDEINKLKLNLDREIVIGFFNELLDRFKIFWKLKNTEFIWTSFDNVEANYNLNNCDISKVFRFIIDVLSNSIKKGLSGKKFQTFINFYFYLF
ncbi:hypothetical protein PVAND_002363 [Polypedilum vanderplanki]|uniref:Uncharacterized protein n=1 Tax=Polypedilum vanderplanki TaxID=319348 RepID=A0A9J6BRE6_POLVA|nr:hypothetical protein PVAND_002363 [Polypedilum vanderplanki]